MNPGTNSSPVNRVLGALERAGCAPRRNGRGWQASCPAHDDLNPSLSINEGDDGRVLVYCFAGCDLKRILQALDLGLSELFASDGQAARARVSAGGVALRPPRRNK